jgi:hypothetical protein
VKFQTEKGGTVMVRQFMKKRILSSALICILCSVTFTVHADGLNQAGPALLDKEDVINALDRVFKKINEEGYTDQNFNYLEQILPQEIVGIMESVTAVANLDLSTEEKVELLAETLQFNCNQIISLWLIFELIGFFLPVSLITNVLFWLAIICIIGF